MAPSSLPVAFSVARLSVQESQATVCAFATGLKCGASTQEVLRASPSEERSGGGKKHLPASQRATELSSLPPPSLYPSVVQQGKLDVLGAAVWCHGPEMGPLLLVLPTWGWGGQQMPDVMSQAGCQRQECGLALTVTVVKWRRGKNGKMWSKNRTEERRVEDPGGLSGGSSRL